MRLYSKGDRLLLDPAPLDAAGLARNAKFKLRCRRFVAGEGTDGTLELKMPGNDADFRVLVDRFSGVASALGCELNVDPALDVRFSSMRELAEEHYRAGNEIKRGDPRYDERFRAFADVVSAAMVRPLKDRQMRDAFFLATMGRAGNFSVPGSGKTATVLGAFAFLAERGRVRRLMVVCPKNAFDSWRTEWRLCFGEKRTLACASTQDEAYRRLGRQDRRRFVRTSIGARNLILVNYEAAPGVADELAQVAAHEVLELAPGVLFPRDRAEHRHTIPPKWPEASRPGPRFCYSPKSTLIFSASSWSGLTSAGVSIIRQFAPCALGKATTSRKLSLPVRIIVKRSRPKAKPPCGGVPYLKASVRKPKRCCASSSDRPIILNIFACMSLLWMRIEPEPISMPFITRS